MPKESFDEWKRGLERRAEEAAEEGRNNQAVSEDIPGLDTEVSRLVKKYAAEEQKGGETEDELKERMMRQGWELVDIVTNAALVKLEEDTSEDQLNQYQVTGMDNKFFVFRRPKPKGYQKPGKTNDPDNPEETAY